ncbi:MAG: hypothetical protein ACRDDA_03005 [Aeromonas sp.]
MFPWSGEPSSVPAVDHWFRESERVWDLAHVHLQQAVRRHQQEADARRAPTLIYQPQVWLSTRDIRLRLPCKKLSPRYIGPLPIQRQINPVIYRLNLPPHYRISPSFHVSLLKPHTDPLSDYSSGPSGEADPPPPEVLGDESIYTVNQILDSCRRRPVLQYLVDWESYGPEEHSWVNRSDILDPSLLEEFHRTQPNRPAP